VLCTPAARELTGAAELKSCWHAALQRVASVGQSQLGLQVCCGLGPPTSLQVLNAVLCVQHMMLTAHVILGVVARQQL
jgi:hypothetical protein